MEDLIALFEEGGVRACFSGHEHNFQHSRHKAIDYFVSGAGSKIRSGVPSRMKDAHTVSWSPTCHFLLVTINGDAMIVRAIGDDDNGVLREIERFDPEGKSVTGAISVPPVG
jgi:hypothetical protein